MQLSGQPRTGASASGSCPTKVAAIQDKRTEIPKLSRTGIREIDGFSTAITQLSQDILDTSTKFLRIMDMASIELGGYEIREDSDKVFVTDNFFSMLGSRTPTE